MHLGLYSASTVVAAPSSPDDAPDPLRSAQDLVAGDGPGGVELPILGVLTGRDDRGGPSGGDGFMAFAGVEGTIGGDGYDLLLGRDLVEHLGQQGRIAHIAGGELGGTDFQGFLIDPDVDLAPNSAFRAAMLAGAPLAFSRVRRCTR